MDNANDNAKSSPFRTIVGMMMRPAGALRDALASRWYLGPIVSALAFGLFFTQTGLDLYKTGQKDLTFVFFSAGAGLAYGLIVIPLLAVVMWLVLKIAKSERTVMETVSVLCLSYSGALIYGIFGLIFSLVMSWKTAVAFGVTGVMWAIGPMMYIIRELSGGKNALSVPMATIVSALVLISWSFFGTL